MRTGGASSRRGVRDRAAIRGEKPWNDGGAKGTKARAAVPPLKVPPRRCESKPKGLTKNRQVVDSPDGAKSRFCGRVSNLSTALSKTVGDSPAGVRDDSVAPGSGKAGPRDFFVDRAPRLCYSPAPSTRAGRAKARGEIAQSVEHRNHNPLVVGSSPSLATILFVRAPIVYRLGHMVFIHGRAVRLRLGVPCAPEGRPNRGARYRPRPARRAPRNAAPVSASRISPASCAS